MTPYYGVDRPRETAVIDFIIAREGGYVDMAADKGGPTNMGITIKTLSDWLLTPQPVEAIKNLELNEARNIYLTMYIDEPKFHRIQDDALFALVVDSAVLHGTRRVTKWLQRATGQVEDGKFGPLTQAAVNAKEDIYWLFLAERVRSIGAFLSANRTQAVFAAGWLNRIAMFFDVKKIRGIFD